MNALEKIQKMEKARGHNRPLPELRNLLDTYLQDHTKMHKIQIAGTNGKGSTVTWLRNMYEKLGYKVGTFTSPHIKSHMERISINGESISIEEWERIYDTYADLFENEHFTMFEMDLFMAVAYFLEQDVDIALMEAGLGGRYDATTALDYDLSLITNVQMDHMEYLGNTREEIARNKAGIIKENTPVITSEPRKEIIEIFLGEARKKNAPLQVARLYGKEGNHEVYFSYYDDYLKVDLVRLPVYQLSNLALALNAFQAAGHRLSLEQMQEVIDNFIWQGRYQIIQADPMILVDGAHNLEGVQALVESLGVFEGDIYFSALKEKQVKEMIQELQRLHCPIYLVSFESERLADLEKMQKEFDDPILVLDECLDRLHKTKRQSLVCGSLYFVSEIINKF